MSGSPLFTLRHLPLIAEMLAERGIDVHALLRAAGLPAEAITQELTAPVARVQAFIDAAAATLELPLFGIELADRMPRGAYGVLAFLIRAAPTVQQGLEALCELSPIVNPLLDMRYVADQRGCEIRFGFGALRDALGAHLNEFTVAFVSRQFSEALGKPLPLERAWFAHARPAHAEEVARRLGCHVAFQSMDCGFAASAEVLAVKPPYADPALFEFLSAQARTQLQNLGREDVIAKVVRVLEARLAVGDVSANAVAQAMGLTTRSLQRHLGDAGTTYRAVLVRVRQRRRAELERAGHPPAEVAARLGFASIRSMERSLEDDSDAPEHDT